MIEKGHSQGQRATLEEREQIVNWIRKSGKYPTPTQIAYRFGFGVQTVRLLIRKYNLYEFCYMKGRRKYKKNNSKITVSQIHKKINKHRLPYKKYTKDKIMFFGQWEIIDLILDSSPGRLKLLKPEQYQLPTDMPPVVAVKEL